MTSIPKRWTNGPHSGPGRQEQSLLEFPFTERHPGFAVILTLFGLIVLGVTTGGALGRLAAELIKLALAQV